MLNQSLPSLKYITLDAQGRSVWPLLLAAEATALKEPASRYRDNLIGVRVLGFFLLDFWNHEHQHSFGLIPYHCLRLEIASCFVIKDAVIGSPEETVAQHEKVCQLGLDYRNFLMRVFRSDADPMPTPSSNVSRPSFDKAKERIVQRMKEAPQTRKDAKDAALFRDGYRCTITGFYDFMSCATYPQLKEQAQGCSITVTQCAHLFSESAQDANKPAEYAATAFAILERFGLSDLVPRLLGGQVNGLLTMSYTLYTLFDQFAWWLEEVRNEVDPAAVDYCLAKGYPAPELPDSRLIAIRAACARVAHMSGAAEHIEEIIRDRETTTVLADNGGSAELLTSLLRAVDGCG
ncbi:hypothetical protein BDZ89DRAFT_1064982 [Hymenopellis radicata]|nr:hypothetical protein BDZ89DRAFT_1064982 [Hymenopellis radicata]